MVLSRNQNQNLNSKAARIYQSMMDHDTHKVSEMQERWVPHNLVFRFSLKLNTSSPLKRTAKISPKFFDKQWIHSREGPKF